jgi:2-polyprenyl-3-methyl-5-hydroxy-6-metoxy-1,4-benzoquinol methylase
MLKSLAKSVLNRFTSRTCRLEWESQAFTRFNERPVEFAFVFRQIAELCPRSILDVGSGTTALPHLMRNCGPIVTAIDNVRDYWDDGMTNRHFHVIDDDITKTGLTGSFDMVTCVSVLEHIHEHDAAVANMLGLLRPGGHLVLTCPYSEPSYVPNVYKLRGSAYGQDAPYVTQSYSRAELNRWFAGHEILTQEFWRFWTGDHWTIGQQVIPGERVGSGELHQLTCLVVRKATSPADSRPKSP